MKILHVLSSPRAEGTPKLVLDWLTVKGHEQYVVFLSSEPADLLPEFKATNVPLELKQALLKKRFRRFHQIVIAVKDSCKKYSPDIVISWNQGYSEMIILGARLGGVKYSIVHGGCEPEYEKSIKNLLYAYFIHWPLYLMKSKLICASKYIEDRFRKMPLLPTSNIFQVYNCLKIEKFINKHSSQNSSRIAIMVGNLEPKKNHITLLKAWKKVIIKIPKANLWIVGDGSMRNRLEEYCKENHLENNVIFWGARQDVPELLWKSKAFVFPSLSEGFGTVLIEALAARLNIVASDIPACKEILKNGKYGTIVNVDDIDAFSNAIINALLNPIAEDTIFEENLNYLNNFSPENMVNSYLEIVKTK
jgi:glycosyltransferase involved in cell wall biosynthesis